MSTAQQKRRQGKIPYEGTCSDCGEYQVVGLAKCQDLIEDHSGQYIRCPDCDHINYWHKAADNR